MNMRNSAIGHTVNKMCCMGRQHNINVSIHQVALYCNSVLKGCSFVNLGHITKITNIILIIYYNNTNKYQ